MSGVIEESAVSEERRDVSMFLPSSLSPLLGGCEGQLVWIHGVNS